MAPNRRANWSSAGCRQTDKLTGCLLLEGKGKEGEGGSLDQATDEVD